MSRKIGLVLGLFLFFYSLFSTPPANMSEQAWITAGVGMLMAVWWVTQVLPLPVTSLLPIILFPLIGISSVREATVPYVNPVIFLLLGGFIIATALQRWQLHRRLALTILHLVGSHPHAIVGGFMVVSALLSMWISNTATTIMMLPIAISLAHVMLEGQSKEAANKFTVCLMLGIAYAASIGGLGTLIGTPPNAMVAAFMTQTYGINIGFVQWMSFGLPVVFILLPIAWLLLTRLVFTFDLGHNTTAAGVVDSELEALGLMTTPEKRTAIVFVFIALAWVTRPLLQQIPGLAALNDTIIAVVGAVSLFLIPSGEKRQKNTRLLNWSTAKGIPWGVLLLFGGGLSLAAAISSSGLAAWLGTVLSVLTSFHVFTLLLSIVAMVVFLTELTSNTATTATLLPVLGGIATAAYLEPMLLIAPMALAASCAFMLPVATAPNAIVFGSGKVSIPQMARAGFCLNLVAITLITPLAYLLIPLIFL
ncbi:MAG: DASS family sodium-coupled anion symporter [Nitrosomonadaceae bacterium]